MIAKVNSVSVDFLTTERIVSTSKGIYAIDFEFDSSWNEYTTKTAVFRVGAEKVESVILNNRVVIPETILYYTGTLFVGVYGTINDPEGKPLKVRPTVWSNGVSIVEGVGVGSPDMPPTEDEFRTAVNDLKNGQTQVANYFYIGPDPAPDNTIIQVDPDATGAELVFPDVMQETGESTEDVMSQKAISDELKKKADLEFVNQELNKQVNALTNAMPHPTQEGESVLTLTDSTDYRVLDAEVKGTTKQNPIRHLSGSVITADNVSGGQVCPTKVESANLIPFPYLKTGSETINGITFTVNEDASIHVQGRVAETKFSFFIFAKCQLITKSLDSLSNPTDGQICISDDGKKGTVACYLGCNKDKEVFIIITNIVGTEIDTIVKPMLNRGTEALPYTPYVDLQSAEVSVSGSNVLDGNIFNLPYTNRGVTTTFANNTYNCKGSFTEGSGYATITNTVSNNISTKGKKIICKISNPLPFDLLVYFRNGAIVSQESINILKGTTQAEAVAEDDYKLIDLLADRITKGEQFDVSFKLQVGYADTEIEDYIPVTPYTPLADGIVPNVKSVSPNMTLIGSEGITIDTILTEPIVNGELKAIGDNGKNLPSKLKYAGNWITDDGLLHEDSNNEIYSIDLISNIEYTLSFERKIGSGTAIVFYDNADNYISGISYSSRNAIPFTTPSKTAYALFTTQKDVWFQIELGSVATPYEPYKGQTLTLSQPYELSKWDSIFRDTDGKWKVRKQTETEIMASNRIGNLSKHDVFLYNTLKEYKSALNVSYCNKVQNIGSEYKSYTSLLNGEIYGYTDYPNADLPMKYRYFRIEGIKTREQAVKWIDDNKPIIVYKTTEPIITELPLADSQLLDELVTFYPNTTLTTDEGIILNVKYLADIEHFVERKFNELSQKTDTQIANVQALALEG